MARYLKSTTTGVVLPFNDMLRTRPNVVELTPKECEDYEASVGIIASTATEVAPEPEPAPALEAAPEPEPEPAPVVEAPKADKKVKTQDIADGEPSVEDVLQGLEVG